MPDYIAGHLYPKEGDIRWLSNNLFQIIKTATALTASVFG